MDCKLFIFDKRLIIYVVFFVMFFNICFTTAFDVSSERKHNTGKKLLQLFFCSIFQIQMYEIIFITFRKIFFDQRSMYISGNIHTGEPLALARLSVNI